MIDREAFKQAWADLEARFGKEHPASMVAMYHEFLSEQMDTDEFLAAARVVWASFKWWPRPVDFLLVATAGEWPLVQESALAHYGPDWPHEKGYPDGRRAPWPLVSRRSKEAVRMMGGLAVLRIALEKDAVKAKAEWERALEQTTADSVLQLAAASRFKALAPDA